MTGEEMKLELTGVVQEWHAHARDQNPAHHVEPVHLISLVHDLCYVLSNPDSMTSLEGVKLKPCPFCGGEAEILNLDDGENAGGSCISCTRCLASSNVEFGRKENFVSNWNRRSPIGGLDREGGSASAHDLTAPSAAGGQPQSRALACDDCDGPAKSDDFNPIAERVICARCIETMLEAKSYEQGRH